MRKADHVKWHLRFPSSTMCCSARVPALHSQLIQYASNAGWTRIRLSWSRIHVVSRTQGAGCEHFIVHRSAHLGWTEKPSYSGGAATANWENLEDKCRCFLSSLLPTRRCQGSSMTGCCIDLTSRDLVEQVRPNFHAGTSNDSPLIERRCHSVSSHVGSL
jgi:hypothetical protein